MSFDLADVLKGVSNLGTERKQIEYIRLDLIDGDPNNFYQLSGIEELAANIATCDLQQPLLVREKEDGRYIIVSGHRRRAALELLAKEDPERWQEVSCIVERDVVSPALQQLRLIYANSNTRTMTSAELGEQAAQVEKLLYQLKEEGYEFPGRMRDHVAQAVNASKSKLARLKVIRSQLISKFQDLWKDNKLNESQAYTLACQTPKRQNYLWDWYLQYGNKGNFYLTADTLSYRFSKMDSMDELFGALSCKQCNRCYQADFVNKHVAQGDYVGCCHCCMKCDNLVNCKFSCAYTNTKKYLKQKQIQAANKKAAEEKKAKELPEKELLSLSFKRVAQLRSQHNVTDAEYLKTSNGGLYDRDQKRLIDIQRGKAVSLNDRMPGGIWANEAKRLIETADLLGCSIDYMLGRDVPNSDTGGAPENVSNLGTGWRTGTPDAEGEYIVLEKYNPNGYYLPDKYQWTGEEWLDCGEPVADAYIIVDYWTPIPPDIHHPELVPEQDPEPEQPYPGRLLHNRHV